MIAVDSASADEAWRTLARRFIGSSKYQNSRDQPTRELMHVVTSIADPKQRVVFSRPINPAFAIAEVVWILAGADDVRFLSFWNPRMKNYSDDGLRLCGAYGYRMGSRPNLSPSLSANLRHWTKLDSSSIPDQLRLAYQALRETPDSRQVVIQIWDAKTDLPNPVPRSKDVPCNLVGHPLVRDGRLEWLQIMRSNDFMWGFPYNIIQFTTIQEIMAGWLGVKVGSYVHVSDSLHVYQRHWPDLENARTEETNVLPRNEASLGIESYEAWERMFSNLVEVAYLLTQQKSASDLISCYERSRNFPPGYREWMAVLTAEALRRRGFSEESFTVCEDAGSFWGTSWRKWANAALTRKAMTTSIPA